MREIILFDKINKVPTFRKALSAKIPVVLGQTVSSSLKPSSSQTKCETSKNKEDLTKYEHPFKEDEIITQFDV